jgi:hypothetical protein
MAKKNRAGFDFNRWFAPESGWSTALLANRDPSNWGALIQNKRFQALIHPNYEAMEKKRAYFDHLGLQLEYRVLDGLERKAREILNLPDSPDDQLKIDFSTLNQMQTEAARVFIHLRTIKRYCESLKGQPIDFIRSTGSSSQLPHEIGEQIALESVGAVVAAIHGDFWANLSPAIRRGAKQQHHLQQMSAIGVEKRKKQISKTRDLCRSIATEAGPSRQKQLTAV